MLEFLKLSVLPSSKPSTACKLYVQAYIGAIEEIINIPTLISAFDGVLKSGQLQAAMDEIVLQSKVEFNYSDIEQEDETLDADDE